MPLFQVSSRAMGSSSLAKKGNTRARRRLSAVIRVVSALLIVVVLGLLEKLAGLDLWFLILLPVCISIVTGRSQLYNLIHGTLIYDVLTISLSLIYFGGITSAELFVELYIHTGDPLTVIVTTTLANVVLFELLRVRIQAWIERHFNIHDHDARNAIEAFNSTLREEIDLYQLRERLFTVVQKTMQPQSITVWMCKVKPQEVESHLLTQPTWEESAGQTLHKGTSNELQESSPEWRDVTESSEIVIADNDPIIAYALSIPGVLEIERLKLDLPILRKMRTSGVEIALPLASQGELLGMLTLGPCLNGLDYEHENLSLLNMLAAQVAPALRVAQMVQEQKIQVRERERIEQELRTAQFIQQSLLPKEVPALPGWQITPYYQPAREVGGDFYDFLTLPDGHLGIVLGDATGKGVPAALMMATTHAMLCAAVQGTISPGEVLARVNDLLYREIPSGMFVTCFFATLDPVSGRLCYANAGQELPYKCGEDDVSELWATGMPLGMMPGSCYEEREVILAPGENVFFHSDGLVEAHNSDREMFGFPRIKASLQKHSEETSIIEHVLDDFKRFTGAECEQEDDITLVTLQRMPAPVVMSETQGKMHTLQEATFASAPGNEREAMEWVADVVHPLDLLADRLANLKTAVAEVVMNAMEHGNGYRPESPVALQVLASETSIQVCIRDQGADGPQSIVDLEVPDLEAKLAGLQTPRGWGIFLIKNLVDEVHVKNDEHSHTVEVIMYRDTAKNAASRDTAKNAAIGI